MNKSKTIINEYKEVNFDTNGREVDRFYKNPLTRVLQYEYALYLTVANLFESVRCKSMCVDSMKLYFMELGHRKGNVKIDGDQSIQEEGKKGRCTQEDLLAEMEMLVNRDVTGHIIFPMMHICAAEAKTILEEDGSHSFVFTDGIYGFRLHLDNSEIGHPRKIEVTDLSKKEQVPDNTEIDHAEVDHATVESVAWSGSQQKSCIR